VFSRLSPAQPLADRAAREELWYNKPAERWLEALPVGNGRLGGVVYGGTQMERIALSESTAWSGAPAQGEVNPDALTHLNEIRQLFFSGKYDEAQKLCGKYLPGHSKNFGTNLPLPELQLDFANLADTSEYRRSLSLEEAIARVTFRSGAALFTREILASHADGVLAIRLTCNSPGSIRFRMNFSKCILPSTVKTTGDDTLILDGHAWEKMHSTGHDGVALQIRAQILAEAGRVTAEDQAIKVDAANSATVLLAIGTNFAGADPEALCQRTLNRIAKREFAQLRKDHLVDYQPLYRRTAIDLGESLPATRQQHTDIRREALEAGTEDPELLALFFNYGRYLMISGSRADSPLPLALQGIWNDGLASSMGWTDDFHLDINTQQNYWPAEVCNLAESQIPLFHLIELLRERGRTTAKEMYGAPGWVTHTVTNPWGFTAPGSPGWGIFVTAGIWITLQMWDHWTFNRNINSCARLPIRCCARQQQVFCRIWLWAVPRVAHYRSIGLSENWYVSPQAAARQVDGQHRPIVCSCVCAVYDVHRGVKTLAIDRVSPEPRERAGETAALPDWQARSVAGMARALRMPSRIIAILRSRCALSNTRFRPRTTCACPAAAK
jgi:alpha-L-fucosidase 2